MKESAKHSAIRESISGFIICKQKAWVVWIGSYANRLSRRGKEVMLALFIVLSVSWSLFLMIRQPLPTLKTDSITTTVPMENNKGSPKRMLEYRIYLDSLSRLKEQTKYGGSGACRRDSLASMHQ
jgi:hypothetical protein